MIGGERGLHRLIAHAFAGGIGHLGFLEMEPRVREVAESAGMIKVHVRYDQGVELLGVDVDLLEDLARQHLDLCH